MSRNYTKEFKQEAVDLLISSGKSIKQIAKDLGCPPSSLGTWRRKHQEANPASEVSTDGMSPQQLWEHNKRLEKELKIVIEEREILKKAAAILGR